MAAGWTTPIQQNLGQRIVELRCHRDGCVISMAAVDVKIARMILLK
jgi:hypothetical protein